MPSFVVIITLVIGLFIGAGCFGQNATNPTSKSSTEPVYSNQLISIVGDTASIFRNENLLNSELSFFRKDTGSYKPNREEKMSAFKVSGKPLLRVENGYVNYTYYSSSGLDTIYTSKPLSQHLVNANCRATIANRFPLTIFYYGRETNNEYFKSYENIQVDFDVQRFKHLQRQNQLNYFKSFASSLNDKENQVALSAVEKKLTQCKDWMNNPDIVSKLIHSKEVLIRKEFQDTSLTYKDSIINKANEFIRLFEKVDKERQRYERLYDSVQQIISKIDERIRRIDQLTSKSAFSSSDAQQLVQEYGQQDEHVRRLLHSYEGIRVLTVGRSAPNFSNLSLQNININGLHVEYNEDKVYLAAAGGMVDYRYRDFLSKNEQVPKQYVFSARAGYGKKESNNIIFTYYGGRKQLFGGNLQQPTSFVQGLSITGQYFIEKDTKIYGEIAQSGLPYSYPDVFSSKSSFHFSDHSQQAYAAGLSSEWKQTGTRINGYFQHTGANFQSFNSFPYNSVVDRWYGSIEQHIWKNQLTCLINIRKNDFANTSVLQRYNANTIFKNITLSFRKPNWPTLSVGFLPSSQYTVVDSIVYENHYQTFTATSNYQYKIGLIRAISSLVYSRFYNNSKDSAFVYFNAKNMYWNQLFMFQKFNAAINLSASINAKYRFYVMEESLSAMFFKKINITGSVKISDLNEEMVKIGFSTGTRFSVKNMGEISICAEKNYLPTTQNRLYQYQTYNIGFTRYFK